MTLKRSDAEWRDKLTPEQYRILRQAGTEPPGSGPLLANNADGMYRCAGCGVALFGSDRKYDSGCGWPSFTAPSAATNVEERSDTRHGMARTEVRCAACEGHLGHVFADGPGPAGLRYCINSVSLTFDPNGQAEHDEPGATAG